jgi:hypothetical protein
MAITATTIHPATRRAGVRRDFARRDGRMLDAKSLPLPTNGLAQIVELRRNRVIDRFARASEIVAEVFTIVIDVLADLIARHAVPHLAAAMCGPSRAGVAKPSRMTSGPTCTASDVFHQRHHRSSTRRSAAKQIENARSDRNAEQRGGE